MHMHYNNEAPWSNMVTACSVLWQGDYNTVMMYHITTKVWQQKLWQMKHKQNFDKLIVGFIGEILREKDSRENFDKSLAIHRICQSILPSNLCAIRY